MVFRKSVTTDCIIPSTSCHPPSHKLDSLKFFFNRIYTYPLEEDEKDRETQTIRQIMENNQLQKAWEFPQQQKRQRTKRRRK
jgi:hypothetical protein